MKKIYRAAPLEALLFSSRVVSAEVPSLRWSSASWRGKASLNVSRRQLVPCGHGDFKFRRESRRFLLLKSGERSNPVHTAYKWSAMHSCKPKLLPSRILLVTIPRKSLQSSIQYADDFSFYSRSSVLTEFVSFGHGLLLCLWGFTCV